MSETPEENKENPEVQDGKKTFGEGKKALVVDDDPSSLELAKRILSSVGFEIVSAQNGQEALNRIPEENPNIIIADVVMPEMDGFSFFKELREDEATKKIPVLIFTVRKNMEDSFLAIGADDFITKPINTEEFLEKTEKLSLKAASAPPPSPESEEKEEEKK